MHKKELIFTIAFTLSLMSIIYFLGSSITGHVVQTMYCEDGICDEFCKYNKDCTNEGEVCCDVEGFGVCRVECEEE